MVLQMIPINAICKRGPTPVADGSEQRCLQEGKALLGGALGVPKKGCPLPSKRLVLLVKLRHRPLFRVALSI